MLCPLSFVLSCCFGYLTANEGGVSMNGYMQNNRRGMVIEGTEIKVMPTSNQNFKPTRPHFEVAV